MRYILCRVSYRWWGHLITTFMENKTYSEKLKDPRWQKKRLEIMQRDKWKCTYCFDSKTTLHVHHESYNKNTDPWNYDNDILITLCEHCHLIIESLKKYDSKVEFIGKLTNSDKKFSGNIFVRCKNDVIFLFKIKENTAIELLSVNKNSLINLLKQ